MRYLTLTFFAALLLLAPQLAFAENPYFSVTPAIITEKALPRDILKHEIVIESKTSARMNVYTFVNNIDPEDGEQEFKARDQVVLGDSLANWIQVRRASLEMEPFATATIPVTTMVNLNAKPGIYHATIGFSQGTNRKEAEDRIDFGSNVVVTIEVIDDIKERLQIGGFATNKIFLDGPNVSFSYDLENVGNRDLKPQGEVRIYDRRGQEVGSVPANIDGTIIPPSETGKIASAWTAGKSFGKYKALLDIEYGSSQIGTVNDTIYFWIIPWKQLLSLFLTLATIVGAFTYIWWRRRESRYDPAYAREEYRKERKFDKDSLLVPQHSFSDGSPKSLSDDHLLNLRG